MMLSLSRKTCQRQEAVQPVEIAAGFDPTPSPAGSLPIKEDRFGLSDSEGTPLNPRQTKQEEVCRLDLEDRVPEHYRRLRQLAHAGHVMVAQGWEFRAPVSHAPGAKRRMVKTSVWAVTAHVGFCNILYLSISRVSPSLPFLDLCRSRLF